MNYLLILILLYAKIVLSSTEVVKPDYSDEKIELRIIRSSPDSYETYKLINYNSREMMLVCAKNRVYDNNKKAFIEYRNFYNEIVARFTISDNNICLELGRFIENIHMMISEKNPISLTLERSSMEVTKIVYPGLDPYTDDGEVKDLFQKKKIIIITPIDTNNFDEIELE